MTHPFTDFLVTSVHEGGKLNPEGLDATLKMMGAALICPPGQGYVIEDGCYIMRVFGDPGYLKFACEHQGYCKIVRERNNPEAVIKEVVAELDAFNGIPSQEPPHGPEDLTLPDEPYSAVARIFANRVNEIFATEKTLEECFQKHYPRLKLDRTDHWSGILHKELDDLWRLHGPDKNAPITPYDRYQILHLDLVDLLDFNLYSQVALNLQNWSSVQYSSDVSSELKKLEEKWSKREVTPLSPKATMIKNAWKPEDKVFNEDLSRVKALKTITELSLTISFRVSPKGSTPAFADSQNFSTIGIGGDKYVKTLPENRIWYVVWKPTPQICTQQDDGGWKTAGIDYTFYSKSGGTILNEVLFSRGVAYAFWSGLGTGVTILPRMNSVMVVAPIAVATDVREIFESVKKDFPVVELHEMERKF